MQKNEQLSLLDFIRGEQPENLAGLAEAMKQESGLLSLQKLLQKAASARACTQPMRLDEVSYMGYRYENLYPQSADDIVFLYADTQMMLNGVQHVRVSQLQENEQFGAFVHALSNPKSTACNTVVPTRFQQDYDGAYRALEKAIAFAKSSGIMEHYETISSQYLPPKQPAQTEPCLWHPATEFTEKEAQAIKAYYLRQLPGRSVLAGRQTDLSQRSRETDTTFWMLDEALRHLPHEEMYCLPLDRESRIREVQFLSSGSLQQSIAPITKIAAILSDSINSGILLVHNHPSGDTAASVEDIKTGMRLHQMAEALQKTCFNLIAGDGMVATFGTRIHDICFQPIPDTQTHRTREPFCR